MKSRIIALAVMIAVIGMANTAISGNDPATAATPGLKIGVVDMARALNEVNEGKKAKASLEREFKNKKTELDRMKNEMEATKNKLETKGSLLSQEALKTERDNFQRSFMEYQQKAKDYTEQLARKESEMTSKIIGKLRDVVGKVAQKDGYTFVLEKSQGGVLYGPNNSDITTQVIKLYNK